MSLTNALLNINNPYRSTEPFVDMSHPSFNISGSSTTTTGSITSGSATLVVASDSTFKVGQGIYVVGAGVAGVTLRSIIAEKSGYTLTLEDRAGTTVSGATVGHDDTVGVQAALDYMAATSPTAKGTVMASSGTFNVWQISIPSGVWLVGNGKDATIFKAIPGDTASSVILITGTTKRCGLEKLKIDGNKSATGTTCAGLYVTSSNAGLEQHVFNHLQIADTAGNGATFTGTLVGVTAFDVQAITCDGHGFQIDENCTDSTWTFCYTNLCGLNGWHCLGGTNHFIGCGSDDNGTVDAVTYGDGWVLSGSSCNGCVLSGCSAQNNLKNGLTLSGTNASHTIHLRCYDNRNDAVAISGGTGSKIFVTGVETYTAAACVSMLNATGGSGNVIDITYEDDAILAGNPALIGAALETVGEITLNGVKRSSVSFGSSDTVTASVVDTTETAFATTFSIPANYFVAKRGYRVTLIYETTSTASPTLTLRLKLGATNIYASAAIAPASATARGGSLQFLVLGTAAPGASVNVDTSVVGNYIISNAGNGNATTNPVAVATNGALVLSASAQWSANTAGNSVTLRALVVEQLTGAVI